MAHSFVPKEAHPAVPPHLKLQKVVVISRHGDRAPIAKSLGSIIKQEDTESIWHAKLPSQEAIERCDALFPPKVAAVDGTGPVKPPEELPYGQLTLRGAEECHALGCHLRPLMFPAAGAKGLFQPGSAAAAAADVVTVRCTHMRRTQHSAQNILSGLGLGSPDAPLPLSFRAPDRETLFPNAKNTGPRQFALISEIDARNHMPEDEKLQERVAQALGIEDAAKLHWSTAREVLTCHEAHGVPMQEAPLVTPQLVAEVVERVSRQWGHWFRDPEMARLSIGPLLGELLEAVGGTVGSGAGGEAEMPSAAEAKRLLLLSGHDTTLLPLLCVFGIYDDTWPGYASYITVEVADREDSGQATTQPQQEAVSNGHPSHRVVRIVYNGREQTLQGASSPWISLEDFRSRLEPLAMSASDVEAARSTSEGSLAGGAAAELQSAMDSSGKSPRTPAAKKQ